LKVVYVSLMNSDDQIGAAWRIDIPLKAIIRTGLHQAAKLSLEEFVQNTTNAQETCMDADVIVIHRRLVGPVLNAIQRWKAYDKKIFLDMDLSLSHLTPEMDSYDFWNRGVMNADSLECLFGGQPIEPLPTEQLEWGLRMLTGVSTSSRRLADDLSNYTQSFYLPSFVELDQFRNQTPMAHEGILIGLGTDGNHLPGILESSVLDALSMVCRKRPQVRVVITGGDQRIYDHLAVPARQKLLWPWVKQEDWPRYLSRVDIGLAPLAGEFDQRRGWERVMEYLVMKIPWVASEGSPYRAVGRFGRLVNNQPDSWEKNLLEIVDHLEEYRADAAGEPYLFALSQDIDENINKILMAYQTLDSVQ